MPTRLRRSPLFEALFEIRFSARLPNAGDILPGMMFAKFGSIYSIVEALPVASVPASVRQSQDEFRFQATHRLRAASGDSLLVGDSVAVAASATYPGWTTFRARVHELLEVLRSTNLVGRPERFSFRYINILPVSAGTPQLSMLNMEMRIMGKNLLERGLTLRTEIDHEPFISTIHVIPNSTARAPDGRSISGLLLDIDTVRQDPPNDFLEHPGSGLDAAHDTLKSTFFALLTKTTLERLDPEFS